MLSAAQVLPEVLQQQARLDDPGAAARREIIRYHTTVVMHDAALCCNSSTGHLHMCTAGQKCPFRHAEYWHDALRC